MVIPFVKLICLAFVAPYLIVRFVRRRRTLPLPPGPPGWPLIGNLLDFPTHAPHETFADMRKQYGPIISLKIMGTQIVVLNSIVTAKDLLEKKSTFTSNRQHYTMAGLVGWTNSLILLQFGDSYRRQRKFIHRQIGSKSSLEVFHPVQEEEAGRFVRFVSGDPGDLIAHCRRLTCSVVLKISHGYSIQEEGDPLVEMANKAMQIFTLLMIPGGFLVDTFPILRYVPEWFPGGGFKKVARRWRNIVRKTADTPYKFVLEHLAKGDALPSLTSRLLQEGITAEEEEILKWASFSMYVGGSDTIPSALSAFFLAMTMYPQIFKKAQAEVDVVVGKDRLPTMRDRDGLPYVNAICKELFRWHVVAPMVSHATTQDIVYEGYFIPKGTYLLGNIWCILSDPETYPDPDKFVPERFIGDNQQPDPLEVCFGWGRRSCPGALLAESTVFICIAMALATLDISRCIEDGVEWVPEHDVEEDMIRRVKPFKCRIVSRTKKTEDLLA